MTNILMSDFETITNPDDCRVWAWGLYDIMNDEWVTHGLSIDSFMEHVSQVGSIIYFHNLAFDGSFILDWLLRHDYRYIDDDKLQSMQFTSLISKMGKFYTMSVRFENGVHVEFRDSLKKIPASVARIAKAYHLPMSKGEIDYDVYRKPGHNLTDDELDYLKRDIVIVGKALKVQFDQGMKKLTTGADSLNDFKHMYGKARFNTMFPILSYDIDAQIRKAYRGGWCYVAPRYRNRVLGGGKVFDVNSLYPSVMYDRVLPFGEPEFINGPPISDARLPLWIASITFTARLREDHHPCIQVRGAPYFVDTEYQEKIIEPITMVITNVDYELWSQQYDMEIISWNYTYMFQGRSGYFVDYIDKWMDIKLPSPWP